MSERVSVIGTGYLGATHAACLAELGHEVVGIDRDPGRIALLRQGVAPFSEPGLEDLLRRHCGSGRLRFSTDPGEAVGSDVHFLCVGTPQRADGLAADLGPLLAAVDDMVPRLRRDTLLVGKSTVPVGTADRLAERARAIAPRGVQVTVAWNPEFLREGHAIDDTLRPDRLVFGVSDPAAARLLVRVYRGLVQAGTRVRVTDPATAELAKAAANSFLATKISFINAIADVCEHSGADVAALADILGDDPRIGRPFLEAGPGFGGGCLPKDVRALAARAQELGSLPVARLLHEVDAINRTARQRVVDAAVRLCGDTARGARIAVLGAAFKHGSDDVRDSPALHVAEQLHLRGARVRVYDPVASVPARSAHPELTYVASLTAALRGADLVVHLTGWPEFARLDPVDAGRLVRARRILDARNGLDEQRWRGAGWSYHGVGRAAVPQPLGLALTVP